MNQQHSIFNVICFKILEKYIYKIFEDYKNSGF